MSKSNTELVGLHPTKRLPGEDKKVTESVMNLPTAVTVMASTTGGVVSSVLTVMTRREN